ncbi:hypothetical protein IKG45_01325 [Candidatus Saccharibacteria bacterium]|nr:hypothetical protein [Candidatus Saccharibacteria bacterium]
MKITIIGAGAFGTALASILEENGNEISFFDPYKFPDISLISALESSETIIFSAPSNTLKNTLKSLPEEAKNLPFINASKGFLSNEPFLGLKKFSIISGPSFSKDIKAKKTTTLTATDFFTKKLFETPWLKIEISHDKKGILLCGTLKNIFAIYSGSRNIKPATKEFRDFLIESIHEMKEILKANGCDENTAELACGFKDLALTTSSENSRNYRLGKRLTGDNADSSALDSSETIEGLSALKSLKTSGLIIPKNLPILEETLTLCKPLL